MVKGVMMQAGRSLDALIAEKVMGLEVGDSYASWEMVHRGPKYSTDIAAAWQVVEKLEERPENIQTGDFELSCKGPNHWTAKWSDWFEGRGTVYYEASADSAPHAICLAALKAVTQSDTQTQV